MKKNLISVLILALVVVNLVLTAILTITVIPQTKKANELITTVCSAINLELQSGEVTDASTIPIDQIATYSIADSMTINLKNGDDGKDHYAVVTVTISMNKESDGYSKYGDTLADREDLIKSEINDTIQQYTIDEMRSNQQDVQDEIVKKLQKMFDSDFIVGVGFGTVTYQ